ncbi:MAG TPA: aryl-sulfate sulfotransferase [bacterium]|nr:aryl-sulfate sulfotransferase [bacterium]
MKAKTRPGLFFLLIAVSLTLGQDPSFSLPKNNIEGFIGPTEVRFWDATKAYNGYTLFAAAGKTYLIDMEGYVVHQWNIGTNPRLLDNGDLLDATKSDPSGFGGFRELDWDGNTIWEFSEKRSGYSPHHDWTRIYNKKLNAYTTLYIANKSVTKAQALAAGANPSSSSYTDVQMDAIVEVDMSGNVVWEWWFFDHIIQDYDSTKLNHVGSGKTIADYPGRININMPGKPLKKDWLHCNSIDYNDALGQIVINSVHGEFYIIDHDNTFLAGNPAGSISLAATKAGDFLYRFGDPARYEQGDPPSILEDWTSSTTGNKQIGGSHDVHWIRSGLPGAGNIQVFNNGEYLFERVSQSYIFELNPYYNAQKINTGAYVNPPDAGYYTWIYPNKDAMKQNKLISNQVVWIYSSKNDQTFFSTIGGSEQRLPNGNTLICSDSQGHLFEVTYGDATNSPQLVWEYINPVTSDGIKQINTDQYPMYNSVFRAIRYTADHPALQGRTLTPKGTISGKVPQYLTSEDLFAGVVNKASTFPGKMVLQQNYPNPFNPITTISFSLSERAKVNLTIFDLMGRKVAAPVDEIMESGDHSVVWHADNLPGDVYIYQLETGSFSEMKKMTLVK